MKASLLVSTLMIVWISATPKASASVSFSGVNSTLAAHADFSAVGSNLILVLSNTSTTDAQFQTDILTAVFFDLTTSNPLTLQSVVAAGPLGIYQQNSSANTNANQSLDSPSVANLAAPGSTNGGPGAFDGGWQYREVFAGLTGLSQTRGVGTNGLNIFNGGQVMSVDNEDYGLTSFGDSVSTSQAQQLFNFPLIKNAITITFSGLPNGYVVDAASVSNVRFQYGTNLSAPSINGIPTPGPEGGMDPSMPEATSVAAWLGLSGLALVLARKRRLA